MLELEGQLPLESTAELMVLDLICERLPIADWFFPGEELEFNVGYTGQGNQPVFLYQFGQHQCGVEQTEFCFPDLLHI